MSENDQVSKPNYVDDKLTTSINKSDFQAIEQLYKLSIETRNFEITQLVQRNNFFMVFQGVLLAGLMQASGGNPIPIVAFLVCATGFVISIFQTCMAAGAKFWQERWEHDVEFFEIRLLKMIPTFGDRKNTYKLFSKLPAISKEIVKARLTSNSDAEEIDKSLQSFNKEVDEKATEVSELKFPKFTNVLTICRFSVSRIPIYSGLAFSLIWLLLLVCTIEGPIRCFAESYIIGFPKLD